MIRVKILLGLGPGYAVEEKGKKRVKYEKANAELGPRLISPCNIYFLENGVLARIKDMISQDELKVYLNNFFL